VGKDGEIQDSRENCVELTMLICCRGSSRLRTPRAFRPSSMYVLPRRQLLGRARSLIMVPGRERGSEDCAAR
jgi:hypothetical protein